MTSAMLSAWGFCLTKYRCTQFHYPVLALSCGMFSAQMGGVLLLPQRHCKWFAQVLPGAKLLWLVVVGAVPKSNPSLSFPGYFCLGTSLTVQRWK